MPRRSNTAPGPSPGDKRAADADLTTKGAAKKTRVNETVQIGKAMRHLNKEVAYKFIAFKQSLRPPAPPPSRVDDSVVHACLAKLIRTLRSIKGLDGGDNLVAGESIDELDVDAIWPYMVPCPGDEDAEMVAPLSEFAGKIVVLYHLYRKNQREVGFVSKYAPTKNSSFTEEFSYQFCPVRMNHDGNALYVVRNNNNNVVTGKRAIWIIDTNVTVSTLLTGSVTPAHTFGPVSAEVDKQAKRAGTAEGRKSFDPRDTDGATTHSTSAAPIHEDITMYLENPDTDLQQIAEMLDKAKVGRTNDAIVVNHPGSHVPGRCTAPLYPTVLKPPPGEDYYPEPMSITPALSYSSEGGDSTPLSDISHAFFAPANAIASAPGGHIGRTVVPKPELVFSSGGHGNRALSTGYNPAWSASSSLPSYGDALLAYPPPPPGYGARSTYKPHVPASSIPYAYTGVCAPGKDTGVSGNGVNYDSYFSPTLEVTPPSGMMLESTSANRICMPHTQNMDSTTHDRATNPGPMHPQPWKYARNRR